MLKSSQIIQTTGNNLVGLWRPSFVKVDQQLFVYGGGGNVTNDLHVLNLCDMRWETIQSAKGIAPCKRYGHTATLWKQYIIVFGGCNEFQSYCNDINIFDLTNLTWCQPDVKGSTSARYLHSAVVHDDKLFVYGGFAKKTDCTYVLDEISVLDLNTFIWSIFNRVPPRYNHSATLIGHKMYIYAGKDEHGDTVSDLFSVNLSMPPYAPHLILSGTQANSNSPMVLLKSQHFCEAVCGKLLVFGRYINKNSSTKNSNENRNNSTNPSSNIGCVSSRNRMTTTSTQNNNNNTIESVYGLWMLDLDTLEWKRQDCKVDFDIGGWNYFTMMTENTGPDKQSQATLHNLLFLGNRDPSRPQCYDHFRDALVINGESMGLYDIPPVQCNNEFVQLLNNPELSDFTIVTADGQELHVHQVILVTRWAHFRNMYKSGMMETQQRRMEISEPYPVVLAFLKYLYSDHLAMDEPWQVVCDILVMANMYLLHRLKKICCQRLSEQHLTIESCTTIFEKAIMTEEAGLKSLVLDYMFAHYGAVIKMDLLHQMSNYARLEFLECIPDEAALHVNSHGFTNATCYPNLRTTSLSSARNTSSSPTPDRSGFRNDMLFINDQRYSFTDSNVAQSTTSFPLHSSAVQGNATITSSTSHQRLVSSNGMAVGV